MPDTLEPVVPPELCDIVIDHLHNDPRTLATCALVCRAWVSSARMHQFHTIVLHRFPRWRGQKLSLITDPSSTILPYVRHLALGEGRGRAFDPYWLDDALPEVRASDMVALQFLELFELNLGGLSPESVSQLYALCRRPQTVALRSFREGSMTCLLDLFQACLSMEKFVALGSCGDDTELTIENPASFRIPPHLHTLELDAFNFSFMATLRRFEPRHSIRIVKIPSIYPERATEVARFMQWCGPTVEQATLGFEDPRMRHDDEQTEIEFCDAGGLKLNTSLRVINITGSPSYLFMILKQVESAVVEHVAFCTAPSAVDDFDFDALATLFAKGRFASTQLRILASDIPVQPLIEAREKVYAGLHDLREQGRLVFERAGKYSMDPSTPSIDEAKWGPAFSYTNLALDTYYPHAFYHDGSMMPMSD